MSTTTLTSKGQLTLPKDIRDRLGLKAGDKLNCSIAGDGEIVLRRKKLDISDLVGILHVPGKRVTVEAMNEAIKEGAVARVRRGLRRK
jgi:AbrB family looped-hinge helix DNA binding protein